MKPISFASFIAEQSGHLEHVEDELLNGGVAGARKAINTLRTVRDTLAGNTKTPINASVKFDGAPAIVAGTDPTDGMFFVAKKGIFNKNPRVYKTPSEIDADTSGDLNTKLKLALKHLPKAGIRGIVQGDFMFSSADLKVRDIDGVEYVTFQPNTIVYAVPTGTPLAKTIQAAKIGIVWHTKFEGSSLGSLQATFATDVTAGMNRVREVWAIDATYRDMSGQATFTADETKSVTASLAAAGKLFQSLPAAVLNDISADDVLLLTIKTALNSLVRSSKTMSPTSRATFVRSFVHQKATSDVESKKTPAGKQGSISKWAPALAYFKRHSIVNVAAMFEMMDRIVEAKVAVIAKMNQASAFKTYLRLSDGGIRATTPEGFVVVDRLSQTAVKLVDRLEFSRANFSPDVIKGFDARR